MNLQKVGKGLNEQLIKPAPRKVSGEAFADKLEIVKNNKTQERAVDRKDAQKSPKADEVDKAENESKKVELTKAEDRKTEGEPLVKEEIMTKEKTKAPEEEALPKEVAIESDKVLFEILSDKGEKVVSLEGEVLDKASTEEEIKIDSDIKKPTLKEEAEAPKVVASKVATKADAKEVEEVEGVEETKETTPKEIKAPQATPKAKEEVTLEDTEKSIDEEIEVENSKFVANVNAVQREKVEVVAEEKPEEVKEPVFELSKDLKPNREPREERGFNMDSKNSEIKDIEPQNLGRNIQRFNFQSFEEVISERFDDTQTVKTMLEDISYQVNQSKRQMTIQLKPESLGEMTIDLRMDKGSIVAKIMVENDRAKEMIEQNLFQLKETLKTSKVEIKTVEVFVGQDNDFRNHQGQMQERQPQHSFVKNLKPNQGYEEIVEEELVANTISGRGEGLDISV